MNKPTTIAVVALTAVASAGITWLSTKESPQEQAASTEVRSDTTGQANSGGTSSTGNSRSQRDRRSPWQGRESTVTSGERPNVSAPAGIDTTTWDRAQRRVEMMSTFANIAREDGTIENRMKERATQEASGIATALGIEEAKAAKIEELLAGRMEKSTEGVRQFFDAALADEQGFAELMAIGEMERGENGITPALEARRDELKKKMFGAMMPDGTVLSDEDLMAKMRPQRVGNWYDDKDFVAAATAELGAAEGGKLQAYAEKLGYLDREERAFSQINRIERNLTLSPEKSQQLMQLYMDNSNPSDTDLGKVLSPAEIQQVKAATEPRRGGRGNWGGGGGGGRGNRGGGARGAR